MNVPSIQVDTFSPSLPDGETSTSLQGQKLLLARILWLALVTLSVVVFIASVPTTFTYLIHYLCDTSSCSNSSAEIRQYVAEIHGLGWSVTFFTLYNIVLGVAFVSIYSLVGGILFWRRSNDWMALFAALSLITFAITFTGIDTTLPPSWALLAQSVRFLGSIAIVLFFYVFPDGRFAPRWVRWLPIAVIIYWGIKDFFFSAPFNLFRLFPVLDAVTFSALVGCMVLVQIYRYRRIYNRVQRQQTKWVVYGLSIAIGGFLILSLRARVLPSLFPSNPLTDLTIGTAIDILLLLIPFSIGVAILRYRLWDINFLINRTLVYGTLTASVVGIYVLVVGSLSSLFQASSNLLISLLATGLVAVLFQPLRFRLQHSVNRLIYGERDDPYRVLSLLGQRLEATLAPEAVLPTVVETVAVALKVPYAAITVKQETTATEYTVAAQYGKLTEPLFRFPLVYQTEQIGELLLVARAAGEAFTPADRPLLDDLARQVGVAVHATRLTADLQRSRERLVTLREEERRRIRRDLHDGLGPTLAALNLQAGVIRTLIPTDPITADQLIVEWRAELRAAISNIRQLVYELRPPTLDELGLVGAIREHVAQYMLHQATSLQVHVEAIEVPTALPAAVEVAAYRIIQEALTNVVQHAQAHTCHITLTLAETLQIEVLDDGIGLTVPHHIGVGLISMRERAAELGGICAITPSSTGGTRVFAQLPLPKEA